MSEGLPELPEGWEWTKIECVSTKPQYGYTTKASSEGNIKLLRTTDITSGKIDWKTVPFCDKNPDNLEKYLLHPSDVVISRAGSIGYSYLIDEVPPKAVFASYLIRFRPITNTYFFEYFLMSPRYWANVYEKKLGIAVANINATKIKNIPFPLPPLPEQSAIVEIIEEKFSSLDHAVSELKEAREMLKTYRQSVLKWAFDGRLTEEWREEHRTELETAEELLERIKREREERYERELEEWKKALEEWKKGGEKGKKPRKPKRPKETAPLTEEELKELPELPEGWGWVKLGVAIESMKNGIYKPKEFYGDEGTPCLRMYNIENGKINWFDIKRMKLSMNEIKEYGLEPGDLLVNRVNSRELVGKTAIIPDWIEKCVYESKNIRLRLLKMFDSSYVNYWFLLSSNNYFNANAQQTVGMASINQEQIANMPFPLCPLPEQQAIVSEVERRLSVADRMEEAIDDALKKAELLRQGILKKAFEGELTRKWREEHPELITGENSAEALLERIKEEKERANEGEEREKRTEKEE